mmetsp:Transcript_5828/g.10129  ORF Transcript_5828/g.10129 Transcript_5828/m.10129 type:complete len:233 (+) Transcript_5828:620-1318(+)
MALHQRQQRRRILCHLHRRGTPSSIQPRSHAPAPAPGGHSQLLRHGRGHARRWPHHRRQNKERSGAQLHVAHRHNLRPGTVRGPSRLGAIRHGTARGRACRGGHDASQVQRGYSDAGACGVDHFGRQLEEAGEESGVCRNAEQYLRGWVHDDSGIEHGMLPRLGAPHRKSLLGALLCASGELLGDTLWTHHGLSLRRFEGLPKTHICGVGGWGRLGSEIGYGFGGHVARSET